MDPVRINVGTRGQANEDITQIIQVLDQDEMKWNWILAHLTQFCVGKLTMLCRKKAIILKAVTTRGKRDYFCCKKGRR